MKSKRDAMWTGLALVFAALCVSGCEAVIGLNGETPLPASGQGDDTGDDSGGGDGSGSSSGSGSGSGGSSGGPAVDGGLDHPDSGTGGSSGSAPVDGGGVHDSGSGSGGGSSGSGPAVDGGSVHDSGAGSGSGRPPPEEAARTSRAAMSCSSEEAALETTCRNAASAECQSDFTAWLQCVGAMCASCE